MKLFSILDRKLKEFGPIVVMNNDLALRRALLDAAGGGTGTMFKYPEDFDVYALGDFDVETGVITPEKVPFLLDCVETILANRGGDS